MNGGRLNIHTRHVLFAFFNIALGNRIRIHAFLNRLLDDLVVHIRKVGDIAHIISLVLKVSAHCVKHDHGPCIPDMDQIIDSGAADIHLDLTWRQGYKLFFSSA